MQTPQNPMNCGDNNAGPVVYDIESPPAVADQELDIELDGMARAQELRRKIRRERIQRKWSFRAMILGFLLTPLIMLYFGKFLRMVAAWCVARALNVSMCDEKLNNLSAGGALSPHPAEGHYGLDWLVGIAASFVLICLCKGSDTSAGCCGCCCSIMIVLVIVAIVEFAGCS